MKHVVERLWVVSHEPEGPLVPSLDAFARALDEQGFKRRRISRQVRVTANCSKWLQAEAVAAQDVTDAHVPRFCQGPGRRQSIPRGEFATLRRFIAFLLEWGVIPPRPHDREATPSQPAVDTCTTSLRQERALSDTTLIQYGPFIERFLCERFGHGPVDFAALRAGDVSAFIKQQATRLRPARAKAATTAWRAYLRYLHSCGEIRLDLVTAVPTGPNWSMSGMPRAIAPDHLRAVFAHCPRDTAVGRRDYAILMLLARLGLRSSDMVSLTLDSIDWETGAIAVAGKGKQAASWPMPVEVGEAMADYLRHGRPTSRRRALFRRACAPIRGLGAQQTIATLVSAAIQRAGLATRHRGSHQFCQALATDMLRHGATLTEIGSVLRHRHTTTTNLYTKVDFAA
jgi:integrase/recombinase XerD